MSRIIAQQLSPEQRAAHRYRPAGSIAVSRRDVPDSIAFVRHFDGANGVKRAEVVTYIGKSVKISGNYNMRAVDVEKYLTEWFGHQLDRAKAKETAREAQKSRRTSWKVGMILDGSWGYDQTNVEFYQVTWVSPSGKSVRVRELAQDQLEGKEGYMSGVSVPAPNVFTKASTESFHIVQFHGNSESISVRCFSLSEWDGRPRHWTAYH